MPETSRFLTPEVIETLKREIHEAGGTEIFAVLTRKEGEERFSTVTVTCRGTRTQVPALLSRANLGDMTLHNHPSGGLQPSNADMNVATLFGEEGVGSMIVDNAVKQCRIVVEPSQERPPEDVEEQEVRNILEPGGQLSKMLPHYEPREGQVHMALAVTQTLNRNQILAVEAGTGTGKSLAYLIPALLWTKRNKGRVTIATKTIALQEQLVFKDIPVARSLIPDAPKASLVKGRNNYVCLRKLNDLKTNQLSLFADEEDKIKKEIEDVAAWVAESGSGDRADLPFMPTREAWDMVRSDADMCLGSKCPFFQKAPFYESRRKAAQSRVIVVNQALLFSDLAVRGMSGNYSGAAVIPPYQHVILDEAHSMEDIATDHFGLKLSSFGLRLTLGKFLSASRTNRGILHRLFQAAVEHQAMDLIKAMEDRFIPDFRQMQEQAADLLQAMSRCLHEVFNPNGYRQKVIWLKDGLLESGQLDEAKKEGKGLLACLHELVLVIRDVREMAVNQSEKFVEKLEGLFIELDARLGRLEETMLALKNFAIRAEENQIPWLELKVGRNQEEFEYRVSPLDVSAMLREALFKPFKSVTMTSATLDLHDRFTFFSSRNGLKDWEEKEWTARVFPSSFDFRKQAKLLLARLPASPYQQAFADDLTDLILKTVFSEYPGGTLVLFTSYQLLNTVARNLERPLARGGVELLVQGRANRSFLAERLKHSQGVLLGTDSFWEGIDLPGEALTKLIITKLPFRQMGDPILEARCAALEAEGKSSFTEYSLPLALLKFKQGAGRLIRHKEDRGVLIVADNRIRTKGYGKRFLTLVNNFPVWEVTPEQAYNMLRQTGDQAISLKN